VVAETDRVDAASQMIADDETVLGYGAQSQVETLVASSGRSARLSDFCSPRSSSGLSSVLNASESMLKYSCRSWRYVVFKVRGTKEIAGEWSAQN
jgi:hypothetical protein